MTVLAGIGLYFAGQERGPATDRAYEPIPLTDQQASPTVPLLLGDAKADTRPPLWLV